MAQSKSIYPELIGSVTGTSSKGAVVIEPEVEHGSENSIPFNLSESIFKL